MSARVYVDGFNLYYGALRGTPFKWLNFVKLAELLLPDGHRVDRLRYFTARVSGIANPGAPARQHAYLQALGTLPEVRVHMGRFLAKSAWRPLTNLPVADRTIETPAQVRLPAGNHPVEGGQTLPVGQYPVRGSGKKKRRRASKPARDAVIAEVHVLEEKGSDVNLGAHLLNDAWKGLFDAAVVISNDTDMVTPMQMVTVEQGKTVFVVCPGRWQMAPQLRNVASRVRHMHRRMLREAQFATRIPGTTITKPRQW